MNLLTDTEHSNPVRFADEDQMLFTEDGRVLCTNGRLSDVFGCPCERVDWVKRSYNEQELAHQARYNDGKPSQWEHCLWAVYTVDWSNVQGEPVEGTDLVRRKVVSSSDLSASISLIAISQTQGVVDYIHTSYWIEDKDDLPNWLKYLARQFPSQ
jgi:hypothetical protein